MNGHIETSPKQRLRALVLDGDAAAIHDVRCSLEGRRFSVRSACDAASGLALLLDELLDLDVLLTDLDLPGRDARSLADLIRRAGGECDLALVVLANNPAPELRAELVALGVDAVVDRSAGPDAAADAAFDAVLSRGSASWRAAEPPAPPERAAPAPATGTWTLSLPRLSLLPA